MLPAYGSCANWSVLLLLLLIPNSTALLADEEATNQETPIALVGGRIATQTDAGTLEGTILIQSGKIAAVGPAVQIPANAQRIDVRNMVITPGLIDAASKAWLTPAARKEAGNSAKLNVLDAIDIYAEDWQEILEHGVTSVYVQPSSNGILGGRGAVLRIAPATTVEELVVLADAGLQASIGTQSSTSSARSTPPTRSQTETPQNTSSRGNTPLTRKRQYDSLKKAFEGAKKYGEQFKEYQAKKAKGDKSAKEPKADPSKDFLFKVLERKIPVRLEAHREDDVANALKLREEFDLRLVLDGASAAKAQIKSLVDQGIPLVLGPTLELDDVPAYRKDRAKDYLTALVRKSTPWALATFGTQPRSSRFLRVQAAAAVAQGVAPEEVLKAITCNAAKILGVDDRLGTIEPGKQADLVVFAGDPLDPSVRVRLVISKGKVILDTPDAQIVAQPKAADANLALPAKLPAQYVLKTTNLSIDQGEFRPGEVLVKNGFIREVGEDVDRQNVEVFDLGSAVVTPGLIAASTDLGLGMNIDEKSEADAGFLRAVDAYDPTTDQAKELSKEGFLTVVFTPGGGNVVGGTASGLRLGANNPALAPDVATKFSLTSGSRNNSRFPASLAGQVELIDDAFSGKSQPINLYLPNLVKQKLEQARQKNRDALRAGEQVALFEVETRAEVTAALQIIRRHELRGVLVNAKELGNQIDQIKQLKIGIVAPPVQEQDYGRQLTNLVRAAAMGVPVAFGSGSAQEMRMTAAMAVNAGMPPSVALQGLTINAATMTGLPEGTGSLTVGQPADFVIWSGSPVDLGSNVLGVIVDGQIQ